MRDLHFKIIMGIMLTFIVFICYIGYLSGQEEDNGPFHGLSRYMRSRDPVTRHQLDERLEQFYALINRTLCAKN